jgi:ankyrin repeat protein
MRLRDGIGFAVADGREWNLLSRHSRIGLAALVASSLLLATAVAGEIHDAAQTGDLTRVRVLLEEDPKLVQAVDRNGATALYVAAGAGKGEVVALLIEKGAVVDQRNGLGRTPFMSSRDHVVAGLLLDRGADINAEDIYRFSLLELAARRSDTALVGFLLMRGAALPAASDPKARAFASIAARNGLVDLLNHLIARGIDLRMRDEAGSSLLHEAATGGLPEIIETLLAAGLSAAEANTIGWTPLHYAAEAGRLRAVEILAGSGAALDARTPDGKTAFNLAQEWGRKDVADVLVGRGADQSDPRFPVLTGPYLGQTLPGSVPEPFATGLVGGRYSFHGVVSFSPDGQTARWSVMGYGGGMAILESTMVDGRWTPPRLAPFSVPGQSNDEPFPSPDGRMLFFVSTRPVEEGGTSRKENIWVMEKEGAGWAEPRPLPSVINSLNVGRQVSVDLNGNLFFMANEGERGYGMGDIYRSAHQDGAYSRPENLGPAINSETAQHSPFIAPDGSYIVFSSPLPGIESGLFISFRRSDGTWTPSRELNGAMGYRELAQCPWVTPDGKYLFFLGKIADSFKPFWVRADFIAELRKTEAQIPRR